MRTSQEYGKKIFDVYRDIMEDAKKYGDSAFSRKVKYGLDRAIDLFTNFNEAIRNETADAVKACAEKIRADLIAQAQTEARKREAAKLWNRFKGLFKK